MHIVVGNISAHYSGRGETELAPYNRIVIYKADGTVSIHADKGFKPMNYMASASKLEETVENGVKVWTFTTSKEKLVVRFHAIFDEINLDLGQDDPGHSNKDGTESQLQDWLVSNLEKLDPTLRFESKEYQTGDGPVDLLASRGPELIAVEVKRMAPMNTVGQVLRYVDALEEKFPNNSVKGLIAAVEFKEKTLEIAKKKNVECLLIPKNWLEDFTLSIVPEIKAKTLFD